MRVIPGGWGAGPRDMAAYLREQVTPCVTQHSAALEEDDAEAGARLGSEARAGRARCPDWGVGLVCVPFHRGTDIKQAQDIVPVMRFHGRPPCAPTPRSVANASRLLL